jgi:hypothetical protein
MPLRAFILRRAAEQRDELAPFHCPVPPVLPKKRIAHLSYGRRLCAAGFQLLQWQAISSHFAAIVGTKLVKPVAFRL